MCELAEMYKCKRIYVLNKKEKWDSYEQLQYHDLDLSPKGKIQKPASNMETNMLSLITSPF